MCKFSFIIPVYNTEKYLGRCIESILSQDYKDFEIICMDDCSTDNSLQILNDYASKNTNIRILCNDINRGLAYVRNRMMREASGEYIWFVDSDDYIAKKALVKLNDIVQNSSPDIVLFGFHDLMDDDLGITICKKKVLNLERALCGKEVFLQICREADYSTSACDRIFKRSFLIEGEYLFPNQRLAEDEMFTLRTLIEAKSVCSTTDELYIYHHHNNSITTVKTTTNQLGIRCKTIIDRKKYLQELDDEVFIEAQRLIYDWEDYVRRHIKEVDFIDRNWLLKEKEISTYLATLVSSVYGGYFPFLLSEESMSVLRSASKKYVYGAGNIGQAFTKLVEDRGIQIDKFIVSDKSIVHECMGHNMMCIDDLDKDDIQETNIYIMNYKKSTQEEMRKKAISIGFKEDNIFTYNELYWI